MDREVTYPYFKAFNQFLDNINILEKVVEEAVAKSKEATATQGTCVWRCGLFWSICLSRCISYVFVPFWSVLVFRQTRGVK